MDCVEGRQCYSLNGDKEDALDGYSDIYYSLVFQNDFIHFDRSRSITNLSGMTDPPPEKKPSLCTRFKRFFLKKKCPKCDATMLSIDSSDQKPKISMKTSDFPSENSLKIYESALGLDIDIVIDEQTIKASKYILCRFSPVFEAMFTDEWKENKDNKIHITDIKFEVMQHLIRYLHGIQCDVDVPTALGILMAADKYFISHVKQQLVDIVKPNIREQNVVQVLEIADKLSLEDLKSKALIFIKVGNYAILQLAIPNMSPYFRMNNSFRS